jgi:hypothetical protein
VDLGRNFAAQKYWFSRSAAKLGGKFGAAGQQIELPNVSTFRAASPSTLIIGTVISVP